MPVARAGPRRFSASTTRQYSAGSSATGSSAAGSVSGCSPSLAVSGSPLAISGSLGVVGGELQRRGALEASALGEHRRAGLGRAQLGLAGSLKGRELPQASARRGVEAL